MMGDCHPPSAQRWAAGSDGGKLGMCWATPAAWCPGPPAKPSYPRKRAQRAAEALDGCLGVALVAAGWLL